MSRELVLYLWFALAASLYMLKRAFYQIKPPNPVATGPLHYLQVAGVPLLFRFGAESAIFFALFTPGVADKALSAMNWQSASWAVVMITQFAAFAFFFGLGIDPMADWVIPTIIGKIPGLKDFWPQMPGPLPQPAVVKAQLVEQTTKVTQLQETTTVVTK